MSLKAKWLIFAILGLLLCGFGISLIGEAIIAKSLGNNWFGLGTIGLIIFNSGLGFFGQAVVFKTKLDLKR